MPCAKEHVLQVSCRLPLTFRKPLASPLKPAGMMRHVEAAFMPHHHLPLRRIRQLKVYMRQCSSSATAAQRASPPRALSGGLCSRDRQAGVVQGSTRGQCFPTLPAELSIRQQHVCPGHRSARHPRACRQAETGEERQGELCWPGRGTGLIWQELQQQSVSSRSPVSRWCMVLP